MIRPGRQIESTPPPSKYLPITSEVLPSQAFLARRSEAPVAPRGAGPRELSSDGLPGEFRAQALRAAVHAHCSWPGAWHHVAPCACGTPAPVQTGTVDFGLTSASSPAQRPVSIARRGRRFASVNGPGPGRGRWCGPRFCDAPPRGARPP